MWDFWMFSCTDHMHTFAYKQSKSPLFSPYHFLLFFPFLHSLTCPYRLCHSSGQRPLSAKRKRRKRAGRVATRGHEEGGGQNRLIWDDTPHVHTQGPLFSRGPCDQPQERVAFFLSCSSFHPPCPPAPPLPLPPGWQETTAGANSSGGLGWIFPDRLSVPMSSGLLVFACTCWQNMNPRVARRHWRTGRFEERGKVRAHLGHMMKPWDSGRDISQAEI